MLTVGTEPSHNSVYCVSFSYHLTEPAKCTGKTHSAVNEDSDELSSQCLQLLSAVELTQGNL